MSFCITIGFVALIVGGYTYTEVELFSPEGRCQHRLTPAPLLLEEPVIAFIDEKVLACDQGHDCFLYNPSNDSWSAYSTSTYSHKLYPGEIFKNKLFIVDDSSPEVFDPARNIWSGWPAPPTATGTGKCLLAWSDIFIMFGGEYNSRAMQTFNHSSQTWEVLDSTCVPMDMMYSGCTVLPTGDILIAGSRDAPYQSSIALFHVKSNTWKKLADSTISRKGTSLVTLGSRVFAIDGGENVVEEFDYNTNTWTTIEEQLLVHRRGHSGVIALPAEMFQHLPDGCVGVQ